MQDGKLFFIMLHGFIIHPSTQSNESVRHYNGILKYYAITPEEKDHDLNVLDNTTAIFF